MLEYPLYQDNPLEYQLRQWAKPPGQTEREKCERSVRMIQNAINKDSKLSSMDISVFAKGSFHKRTNIPSDSDVDVGVLRKNLYFNDYPEGTTDSDFGFFNSSYTFRGFKEDIKRAITNYFGHTKVEIGNKSIKIRSNTLRIDADIVPLVVHRQYRSSSRSDYFEGVALKDENSKIIKNWPKQDYNNAVTKNQNTGERYKAMVRVLKHIRNKIQANDIQSFLIECLLWNVPDNCFNHSRYLEDLVNILTYLLPQLYNNSCKEWGEINELKYLFNPSQPWTQDQAHQFLFKVAKEILK